MEQRKRAVATETTTPATDGGGALIATMENAVQAIGRGFDVTADARLLYCKGALGSRLVWSDGAAARDVVISEDGGGVVMRGVPGDVDVSRDRGRRETTRVGLFQQNLDAIYGDGVSRTLFYTVVESPLLQNPFSKMPRLMAEYFNKKSGLSDSVPLGSFNSMFSFTGCWKSDAAATKALATDGYIIPLYKVKLTNDNLVLREDVKRAVPRSWDPSSLASFIENFGTHIITSVTIGGKDEIFIKQHYSSQLTISEIEKYIKDIGDQRFLNLEEQSYSAPLNYKDKFADSSVSANQELPSPPILSGKEDVTVIFRRRGGDDLVQNHAEWSRTVSSAPDVVNMTFCPITSLLVGMPGVQHLTRAVGLYLEYKPPIEELQYFLEFQIQRVWAPVPVNIPGHQRKEPVCPFIQFSLMGPKLHVSSEQVSVGRKPVTGIRLSLEGSKQNRLAIHLQHLASLPKILLPHWDSHITIGQPKWQGPEEQDSRWFEPIKWKNFAHVSTAPIEYTETSIGDLSGAYIVTGAQLGVWDFGAKSVLHLKLLFSKVPGCTIRRSVWDHSPYATIGQAPKLDDASSSSSSTGDNPRLSKIVDTTEMLKGPQDTPGHWLVTGAKLGVEKGRIVVRVKYSLLNY